MARSDEHEMARRETRSVDDGAVDGPGRGGWRGTATVTLRPLSKDLQDQFPTNWELSTARATNVVRFLTDDCDIPGERLLAAGFSQYRPAATNRTPQGRRRNRRIELTLLPMPQRDEGSD